MIDFLSNPSWIKPQIDFLLFLQNIRINNLDIFDKLFLAITILGEYWLPTLSCAIVYWCIDFKCGIYLFSLESLNIMFAHLFKMIACVYRPWVLDNRILPSELAFAQAKGYSFPSGHSAMSSAVFGGIAYLLRKKKIICITLICIILLIGFSRLWLGVHTPQDVICGLLTGFILVFTIIPMVNWAEKYKHRYLYLLFTINIFAILVQIFINCFNSYRIDYLAGEILVNPQNQKHVASLLYGYSLGIINGCYLCGYFCPFNPKEFSLKKRVLIGLIGTFAIILLVKPITNYLVANIIDTKIAVILMFLSGFFVTFIYPLIFTKLNMVKIKKTVL